MKFIQKTSAQIAEMTDKEADDYAAAKEAHEATVRKEELEKIQTELEAKLKGVATTEQIATFKSTMEDLKEQVQIVKENTTLSKASNESFSSLIEKALTEALPTLKEMKAQAGQKGQELVLEIKAAIPVLTSAAANASGVTTPDSIVSNGMTAYAADVRPEAYIINFMTNGTTDKPSLPYMDKIPNQGGMAVTAEGALKPLISFTFELRYSTATKVAGRVKVSEEALDDIPFLMSIINTELRYEHDIAEQTAIFTKINAVAAAFVAGTMAASTTSPSNYDAIRAAIYMIKIVSKGKYIPNAVLVTSGDVYNMGATKDLNENYVLPKFVLPDGSKIEGVQVVEVNDSTLAAGSFIVGDFRKLHRNVYKGFTVRIGQGIQGSSTAANIQSDFETNMYTVIGESRLHIWLYKNEESAFVKSTFAAVKTAIDNA